MNDVPVNVVITMAGIGKRFRDVGYAMPKYMIEAKGRTLFEWALDSLDGFYDANWIFVVRKEDEAETFIAEKCARLGIEHHRVVALDARTDGQATSALLACPHCLSGGGFLVYNIDTHIAPGVLRLPGGVDGWIPCFQMPGDHWSFVAVDADGNAVEVREKQRISPYCTIGLYYFRTVELYRDTYEKFYRDSRHEEKGERYIAPMYNALIGDGLKVKMTEVDPSVVIALGTPEELQTFLTQR